MLVFNDTEEKAVEKAMAVLADMIPLEAIQPPHSPALVFSGIGNQITPTPGTERRCRHLSNPFGIRRTLLPCRQSRAGIYKSANL